MLQVKFGAVPLTAPADHVVPLVVNSNDATPEPLSLNVVDMLNGVAMYVPDCGEGVTMPAEGAVVSTPKSRSFGSVFPPKDVHAVARVSASFTLYCQWYETPLVNPEQETSPVTCVGLTYLCGASGKQLTPDASLPAVLLNATPTGSTSISRYISSTEFWSVIVALNLTPVSVVYAPTLIAVKPSVLYCPIAEGAFGEAAASVAVNTKVSRAALAFPAWSWMPVVK